jgi:hypothetical protein
MRVSKRPQNQEVLTAECGGLKVSDRIRTGDRLDHKQPVWVMRGQIRLW